MRLFETVAPGNTAATFCSTCGAICCAAGCRAASAFFAVSLCAACAAGARHSARHAIPAHSKLAGLITDRRRNSALADSCLELAHSKRPTGVAIQRWRVKSRSFAQPIEEVHERLICTK